MKPADLILKSTRIFTAEPGENATMSGSIAIADGRIAFGGEIPRDVARKHAREVAHVNGWQIWTTQRFLEDPAFTDLTGAYRDTLESL